MNNVHGIFSGVFEAMGIDKKKPEPPPKKLSEMDPIDFIVQSINLTEMKIDKAGTLQTADFYNGYKAGLKYALDKLLAEEQAKDL